MGAKAPKYGEFKRGFAPLFKEPSPSPRVERGTQGVRLMKDIKFNEKGLIPAIAQDADTGEVLMLGYMNEEALRRTLSSGEAWFYSRSRKELWHKGETSGSIIKVKSIWKDCDNDTILIKGKASGPVCHTGNKTCFFQPLTKPDATNLLK